MRLHSGRYNIEDTTKALYYITEAKHRAFQPKWFVQMLKCNVYYNL